jgi:hypothetical protein
MLWVIYPVLYSKGWLIHVWRQVEQINIRGVLHVEETLLPFLTRLEQLYLWKVRTFLGHYGGRAALGHRPILLFLSCFRRVILAPGLLNDLLAQLELFCPSLGKGLYAGKTLAEGGKGRQNHHRICRQMVGLQVIGIQKVPEEVANRQTKASLKMRDEDDAFARLRCQHNLSRR